MAGSVPDYVDWAHYVTYFIFFKLILFPLLSMLVSISDSFMYISPNTSNDGESELEWRISSSKRSWLSTSRMPTVRRKNCSRLSLS